MDDVVRFDDAQQSPIELPDPDVSGPELVVEPNSAGHPETDLGNAEFLAATYGDALRYDHRRRCWFFWRGHRWERDAIAEVRAAAKAAVRLRLRVAADIADSDRRARAVKWALASEARNRIDSMVYLAQAEPAVADTGASWDSDPWLLGVPDGVVDLRTGQLRSGARGDRITMTTAARFDPRAECPRWLQFLDEVFGNTALVDFVHRAVGYSLTGVTTEQCLFLNYGNGANGKGTFTNTVHRALGDYSYNMPFATVESRDRAAIPNDLAALVGRRFVIASETNDGTRLNEGRIKALTGSDPVTARFLHAEFFSFEPVAKFWLSVNHRPVVRDDSHGFWRRIRLIPFARQFAVDPTLAERLAAEAPGILAWAVKGALLWQRAGLMAPPIVLQATEAYRAESDVLRDFIDEAIDTDDPDREIGARDLFECYRRWARHHGIAERDVMKVQLFGRKIGERFAARKDSGSGVKYYRGLARKAGW